MLLVLIGGLIGGAYVSWNVTLGLPSVAGPRSEAQIAARPMSGAKPGAAPTVVADSPTQPPAAAPSQDQPRSDSQNAMVTGTDGTGVVLRTIPHDNDWTPRGFMDGAQVQILERQGQDWARVRGPNGQEGWIPARYLAPR